MSEVVEAAGARARLRSLLESPACPQLALRVGCDEPPAAPTSPHLPPADVIDG